MGAEVATPFGPRALLGLLTACTLACACSDPIGADFDESAPIDCPSGPRIGLPAPGELYHGVYPGGVTGEEDDITPADVDSYETTVERSAAWVYFSHNWYRDRAFPVGTATWIRERGALPFIRLMLRSGPEQNVEEPLFTLPAILEGRFDDDLAAWGRDAASFGTPLLVEWGTEANGSWFAWNGSWNGGEGVGPGLFRGAYRHIVRTICDAGAINVTWAFHVNAVDVPDVPWNRFESYYPGDDAVDWLGVSAYGVLTPSDEPWSTFADRLDGVPERLTALAPGKPIFVLELGVTEGNPLGDPVGWADAALTDLLDARWPAVRGFSWWNEQWQNDSDPEHDTNMRVQDIPGMATLFRDRLSSPTVVDRPVLSPDPRQGR